MQGHDIVVVGASAGGVEALSLLVRNLPGDFPATVFVVLHIPAQSPSVLASILSRAGKLPASQPVDGEKIETGRIYVAPPDHHLLVHPGYMRLVRGPKENRHRPAVDPLFRSAASAYGPRVIGVVLTGALDDGTAGLAAIKRSSGIAVVQDPGEALYPSMPNSAIENVQVDAVLPIEEMGKYLSELVRTPAPENITPIPLDVTVEAEIAEMDDVDQEVLNKIGSPSFFSCPACHGTLWELVDGELMRYRCRVGHAYSPESLLAEHSESVESALWAALRALEESVSLSKRLAERAAERGHEVVAQRFLRKAHETHKQADVLRTLLDADDTAVDPSLTG